MVGMLVCWEPPSLLYSFFWHFPFWPFALLPSSRRICASNWRFLTLILISNSCFWSTIFCIFFILRCCSFRRWLFILSMCSNSFSFDFCVFILGVCSLKNIRRRYNLLISKQSACWLPTLVVCTDTSCMARERGWLLSQFWHLARVRIICTASQNDEYTHLCPFEDIFIGSNDNTVGGWERKGKLALERSTFLISKLKCPLSLSFRFSQMLLLCCILLCKAQPNPLPQVQFGKRDGAPTVVDWDRGKTDSYRTLSHIHTIPPSVEFLTIAQCRGTDGARWSPLAYIVGGGASI